MRYCCEVLCLYPYIRRRAILSQERLKIARSRRTFFSQNSRSGRSPEQEVVCTLFALEEFKGEFEQLFTRAMDYLFP